VNETMSPRQSPDGLPREIGVKRLNRIPIIIIGVVTILVVGTLIYGLHVRQNRIKAERAKRQETSRDAVEMARALLSDVPDGVIEKPRRNEPPRVDVRESQREVQVPERIPVPVTAEKSATDKERDEERTRQRKLLEGALMASTRVEGGGEAAGVPRQREGRIDPNLGDFMKELGGSGAGGRRIQQAAMLDGDLPDLNMQDRKESFLETERTTEYLPHTRKSPLSPYELKAGSIIPAVMISGINSDLPGQIIAQVSQHVYDTATGQYLLIPQGSRLVGQYDSHVSYGQSRVLVVWRRIVFPDASTLDLGSMPGADQAGYSGFHDKVNNHYWRIFGQALLVSLVTAGVQLSQPDRGSLIEPIGREQEVAGVFGRQAGQLGSQITSRNLAVQPTLEIRPGLRFTVLVNKDVILEPYE
jgi:type IV secretion system protein TrbI